MEIVDITYDYTLMESLSAGLAPGQALEWPIFMRDGHVIGGVRELESWIIQGHVGDLSMSSQLRAVGLEKQLMENELSRALQANSTLEACALQHEAEALDLRLTQIWERMKFQEELREISSSSLDCHSSPDPPASLSPLPSFPSSFLSNSSPTLPSPPPSAPSPSQDPSAPNPSVDLRMPLTVSPPSPLRREREEEAHAPLRAQADDIPLGFISSAIIPVESAVSTIGGALGSLSSMVSSYIWAAPAQSGSPQIARPIPTSEACPAVDFKVVKINWYNRRQYRTLRFFSHSYSRIDPDTGDVRGICPYENIREIEILTPTKCVFKSHDPRTADEWYESSNMRAMISLLDQRALSACSIRIPTVDKTVSN